RAKATIGYGKAGLGRLALGSNDIPGDVDLPDALLARPAILFAARVVGMPAHAQRIDDLLQDVLAHVRIDAQHVVGLARGAGKRARLASPSEARSRAFGDAADALQLAHERAVMR